MANYQPALILDRRVPIGTGAGTLTYGPIFAHIACAIAENPLLHLLNGI